MYLFRQLPASAFWTLSAIVLSTLIIVNTADYFRSDIHPAFLVEKGPLVQQPLWRTAFYFHVSSACVCLATGAALMFPMLLQFRRLHFMFGYIYLNCVLWIAAPSGLILAVNAKGGHAAGVGFALTGIAWWEFTWLGYRAIRKREVDSHIRWMVRSYAIALSAPIFRVIQLSFEWAAMDYRLNYILSVWISLLASVVLAEICIFKNLTPNRYNPVPFINFQ